MSEKYILLKDYKSWLKGTVITVAAPSRFADMNAGYGELYVEPKPEPKVKERKPDVKVEVKTKPEPKTIKPKLVLETKLKKTANKKTSKKQ